MPSDRGVRRVRCRIADAVRSWNLFPLPGPLPEGEGNLFFGEVVIRVPRQFLHRHRGALKRIINVS
jgi:hypothetical protein